MRTGLRKCCILGATALMAAPLLCKAEEDTVPKISSAPVHVALFKNGLGYVERKGAIPKGVLTAEMDLLPIPVHGTFWVYPETEGVELRRIVATTTETDPTERDANSMAELLEANDGQELDLVIMGADGKAEDVKGRVRILRSSQTVPEATGTSSSGFMAPTASPPATSVAVWRAHVYPAPTAPPSAGLLLLETEQGQLVIDMTAVHHVRGKDLRVRVKEQSTQQARTSLKVDVFRNDKGAILSISYLAKGITWAPSYRLDLLNDKTVRIYAKAQIINDLEDLNAARCSVIAGFPNLQFANVVDPMAFRGEMVAWLQHLTSPAPTMARREAVIGQQAVMSNIGLSDGHDMRADFDPAAFAGRGDSDLFFYELGEVNLKRGERGYFPLFTTEASYESVYDCRISQSQQAAGDRGEEFSEDVWHALRLSNNSKQPWTTAPATVTKDGLLLGQDTLYFTSLGSRTLLRFTKALDVRASSTEKELERQRNVPHRGTTWDLVTAEGKISLINLKSVEVNVVIQRTVEGEIIANPEEAALSLAQSGITAANPTANLSWDVRIKPRETAQLTYTYKRYVR
jgi:hypothetical protein